MYLFAIHFIYLFICRTDLISLKIAQILILLKSSPADQDNLMKCDQMRFIVLHSPRCRSHTSSTSMLQCLGPNYLGMSLNCI